MKKSPYSLAFLAVLASASLVSPSPAGAQETIPAHVYSDGQHVEASELGLSTDGPVRVELDAQVSFITTPDSVVELNDGFVAEPSSAGLFLAESRSILEVLAAIGSKSQVNLDPTAKQTAPAPSVGKRFGNGLALDRINNRMIVRDRSGAYIFSLQGDGSWAVEGSLTSLEVDLSLGTEDVSHTVSIYGEWAVVGNPYLDGEKGAVVVFKKEGADWTEHEVVYSPWGEGVGRFGHSVALVNRQLIVGAYRAQSISQSSRGIGRAFIFTLENDTWNGDHDVLYYDTSVHDGSIESHQLGIAVDIYEESAVAAEDRTGGALSNIPQVQVYQNSGDGWNHADTFINFDDPNQPNPQFGWSVSMSGEFLAVGAPWRDVDGMVAAGSVFIYRRTVEGTWEEYGAPILAWDAATSTHFGHSVDLFGDTLVVGKMAGGARYYVYRHDPALQSWRLHKTLDLDSDDAGWDYRVAVGENYVVVARPEDSVLMGENAIEGAGSLNVYQLSEPASPPAGGLPPYNYLPVAGSDLIELTETEGHGDVNVLLNDHDGENGSPVVVPTGPTIGENGYGSLTVSSAGQATFVLIADSVKSRHPIDSPVYESFEYTITDGVDFGYGSLEVAISGFLNHPPELTGTPIGTVYATAGEAIEPIAIPAFVDPEGRSIASYGVSPESWLIVSGNELVGTPPSEGSFDFSLIAYDDLAAASQPHAFTVSVDSGTAQTPIAIDDPDMSMTEDDSTIFLPVTSNDIDSNSTGALSVSRIMNPDTAYGVFEVNEGEILYTLATDQVDVNGLSATSEPLVTTVQYFVSDGNVESALPATVTVTITGLNDAPALIAGSTLDQSTSQDIPLSLDFDDYFEDPDAGDMLEYTLGGDPLPSWLSYDATTHMLSGTPSNGEDGIWSLTVTAFDGAESSDPVGFTVTVNDSNDPPQIALIIGDRSTLEDSLFELPLSLHFSDPDGDSLTYSATLDGGSELPTWLSLDEASGLLSGTPRNGNVGELVIEVAAFDNQVWSMPQLFSLTVENANDSPTITNPLLLSQTAYVGESFVYLFAATDVDPGITTFRWSVAGPSWLNIDALTGELSGVPAASNYPGSYEVTVTVDDQSGAPNATDANVFTISVGDNLPPNDPVAAPQVQEVGATEVKLRLPNPGDNVGIDRYEIAGFPPGSVEDWSRDVDGSGIVIVSDLDESTSYPFVRYRVFDFAGQSSVNWSPIAAVATADATPPSAPSDLRAIPLGPNEIRLQWNASMDPEPGSGVDHYVVNNVTESSSVIVPTDTQEHAFGGLVSGKHYQFSVQAFDADGNSSGLVYSGMVRTTLSNISMDQNSLTVAAVGLHVSGVGGSFVSSLGGFYYLGARSGDLGGTEDSFAFARLAISNDLQISSEVLTFDGASDASKAGLMVRFGEAANARFIAIARDGAGKVSIFHRAEVGGLVDVLPVVAAEDSSFMLSREGSTIIVYIEERPIYTVEGLPFGEVQVGLFVASAKTNSSTTASFANVTISGGLGMVVGGTPMSLGTPEDLDGDGISDILEYLVIDGVGEMAGYYSVFDVLPDSDIDDDGVSDGDQFALPADGPNPLLRIVFPDDTKHNVDLTTLMLE